MTTPYHNLDLISDGDTPWGERMRSNLTLIDSALPGVQATMWALDNATQTTFSAPNTPVKANIPGTQGSSNNGLITFSANRATYSGSSAKGALVVAAVTIQAAGNNKDFRCYLGHNGAVHVWASCKLRATNSTGYTTGTLTGVASAASGDYVELWIANLTDTTAVTVVDLSMSIYG